MGIQSRQIMEYADFQKSIEQLAENSVVIRSRCSPVIAKTKSGVPVVHGFFLTFPRLDAYIQWPSNNIFYVGSHRCLTLCLGFSDRPPLSILELAEQCPSLEPFGRLRWFGIGHLYQKRADRPNKQARRIYISKLIWNPQHPVFQNSLLMYALYHKAPTLIEGRSAVFLTFPSINDYSLKDNDIETSVFHLSTLR